MAKKKGTGANIEDIARKFAWFINKQGIPIKKLIIFGSYAKGNVKADSDIDICLVSPIFGIDPISELQFLLKQTRYVDDRIEPIPVSVKEYKENASPFIFEIKKSGKEIRFR